MKTKNANQKMNLVIGFSLTVITLMLFSPVAMAQEQDSMETLFKSEVKVTELWAPEIKINSIQGDVGTLIGFYGGALFNKTFLLGIAGGTNLSHPRVNYGYFGGIGQYINKPSNLWHLSAQVLLAYGSAKDYENPKSGLLDNFCNVSGAGFFLMEPGVNIELNVSNKIALVAGISYRYVSGIFGNNENIARTHITNGDMSGVNFSIGIKFAKEKKSKNE